MAEPCWVSSSRGQSAYVHLHTRMRTLQAGSPRPGSYVPHLPYSSSGTSSLAPCVLCEALGAVSDLPGDFFLL